MQDNDNNTATNGNELAKMNRLKTKLAELEHVYKDLYAECVCLIEQIEYREITDAEVIEELGHTLLDLGSEDYSFHELFHRLSMYLYFGRDDLDEKLKTGYGEIYGPRFHLSDNQSDSLKIWHFNNALGFIRTTQQDARKCVEKQRKAIREFCKTQGIEIKVEQSFIGPTNKSDEMMDYALTEMVHSMCNIIVVSDISRFGRDAKKVESIIRAFREKGITVYSAKEGDITNFSIPFDPEEYVRLEREAAEASGYTEDADDSEDFDESEEPDDPVLNM